MNVIVQSNNGKRKLPVWADPIIEYLNEVELELDLIAESPVKNAYDIAKRLFSSGGKRLRPSLVVLSALAVDECADRKKIVRLAAAAELVHSASLIHDDVVDNTIERRGIPTANYQLGNKLSVLGGDFLLAKAFSAVSSDGVNEVMFVISNTAIAMAEAEMLQISAEGDFEMWKQNYWNIIKGKTAGFLGACCECGAMYVNASDKYRAALQNYGNLLGYAFQIADDILDVSGNRQKVGKDLGNDLLNGKYTLPTLITVEKSGHPDILGLIQSCNGNPENVKLALDEIRNCGAIEDSKSIAFDYTEKAKNSIEILPDSCYKNSLLQLCSAVVERTS